MMGEVNGHKLRQLPCELRVSLIHKGLTFYKVHEKYPSLNYLFFFFFPQQEGGADEVDGGNIRENRV